MKNKKVTSLLVVGALTVGIVGGTLAWLTATDSATNKFKTSEETVDVDIYEKFDTTAAQALKPGDTVDKKVQIKNSATFDQFIRVQITTVGSEITNENGEITEQPASLQFLNMAESYDAWVKSGKKETWVKGSDGYYYYMGKVAVGKYTDQLLDTVTYPGSTGEKQMGQGFNIKVIAQSIQASNSAVTSWSETTEEKPAEDVKNIVDSLKSMESKDAVGDNEPIKDAKEVKDATLITEDSTVK